MKYNYFYYRYYYRLRFSEIERTRRICDIDQSLARFMKNNIARKVEMARNEFH